MSRMFRRYKYDNDRIILRDKLFIALANRYGYRCHDCGLTEDEVYAKGQALEKHRLVPGVEGGTYHINNVRLLCSECHYHKHPEEYKQHRNGNGDQDVNTFIEKRIKQSNKGCFGTFPANDIMFCDLCGEYNECKIITFKKKEMMKWKS